MPVATDIRYARAERALTVRFDDGAEFVLPAELLRVESPSAEVQGHSPGQKTIIAGKRNVAVTDIEPVGHYAVRLIFDDGHDTGIFSWEYLHELGRGGAALWDAYLRALAAKGLSRDG